MSENKIIEIEQNNENSSSNKNPTWTPLSNGEIFTNYLDRKNNISKEDKERIEKGSITLLGKCIDPSNITEEKLNSTGLCFGQIQSGKTTSMESVFSLAADNNFKILILLTGSVGPLVVQNTGRIDNVLESRKFEVLRNVEKEWDHPRNLDVLKSNLLDWLNPKIAEEDEKTLVILSMKNPSRIRTLTKLFMEASNHDPSKYSKIPTLIVDDECDHHSLNSKASKNDPEVKDENELYEIKPDDTLETICERADVDEPDELFEINPGIDLKNRFEDYIGEKINLKLLGTATHFAITNLRKLFKFHSFLGYTATPNATLVINTFNNLSPSFGEIIEPGNDYTGLDYFFSKQSKIDRFVKYIEENIREYEDSKSECPNSLSDAYLYFLTSVSCALYQGREGIKPNQNMSMIIHPAGLTATHRTYLDWIKGLQDKTRFALSDRNSEQFKELEKKIKGHLEDIKKYSKSKIPKTDEKFWRLFQSSRCLGRTPVPFNAGEGRRGIPPVDYRRNYANILVGGFGLDRGYTVEGLTVTYLCRSLGGRQEDTLLQRARFMGYQEKNSDFLSLWFTNDVLGFFEGEYDRNKKLMKFLDRFLKSNKNLKTWRRFWFGRERTEFKLTRAGVSNDLSFVSRSEPYTASVRCRYSHLLDNRLLEANKHIYKQLTTRFNNQFTILSDIEGIKENHPWTKNQNIKVMEKVPLGEVLREILSQFEYETRDLNRFSILMAMIDNYLDPIQEKEESDDDFLEKKLKRENTKCPIFIFRKDEDNKRSPYIKNRNRNPRPSIQEIKEGPVTSQAGQSSHFEKNFNKNKTLFPGDIRIHWDFLKGISNNEESLECPSIQIHELTITSELNGKGDIIAKKVPYLSFFMPRSLFAESIIGVRK